MGSKVCVRCGRDCSTVPRIRNAQGQYCCRACAPEGAGGIIPLEPVDLTGQTRAPCPECGSDMQVGVPGCRVCGFMPAIEPGSPKLPKRKREKRREIKCRECGYDLTGLKDGTCPECGHVNAIQQKRDWDEETSREVARNAYRVPMVYLVVSLAVTFGVYAARYQFAAMGGYAIAFPVLLGIAYALLWACCATWLGFTSSNLLMLVQLAGIHGTAGAVGVCLAFVPVVGSSPFIVMTLCGAVYVYLMSEWMDMESVDARIVAVIIYFGISVLFYVCRKKGWL